MLTVADVAGGYGDIQVLWGVSVAVEKGHITAVLGRNGAGKTSLLNAIAGFLPTDRPRHHHASTAGTFPGSRPTTGSGPGSASCRRASGSSAGGPPRRTC